MRKSTAGLLLDAAVGRCEVPKYEQMVDQAVDSMLNRVSRILTGEFRERAKEIGWPEDLADRLGVFATDGHHVVGSKDQSLFREAEDQEFGTMDRPPSAAVGSFLWSHDTNQKIEEEAVVGMDDFAKEIDLMFR